MAVISRTLILASQSPRRREILERLGFQFQVIPSEVDESVLRASSPSDFALLAASAKSRDVAAKAPSNSVVLGSDTVVALNDQTLGKPKSRDEAEAMIHSLSGQWHWVFTGVSIVDSNTGVEARDVGATRVLFRDLTSAEVQRYVATGEGDDKAGAYGIQGIGSGLVEKIEGSYDNVVGLPATLVLGLLRELEYLEEWP